MSGQYMEPEKRYENEQSTGIIFTIMGIIGIIAMILCYLDILKFPLSFFQIAVLTLLFLVFSGIGIHSLIKAKEISASLVSENAYLCSVRTWISENQDSFCSESVDSNINELYFQREQEIRDHITAQYPDIAEDLLDTLVEETYHSLFEN